MKKIVCVALALLLCLSTFAMAEKVVPSKNTADMVAVTVDPGFAVFPVDDLQAAVYPEQVELCTNELAKLMTAVATDEGEAVQAYFGEIKDSEGNVVVLSEMLGAEQVDVFEFMPLVVVNYEDTYGDATLVFKFKTPYEKDEKVVLLIGLPAADTEAMEWTAVEGIGVGEAGEVQAVFTSEIIAAIQNGPALLAVVSAR